MVLGSFKILFNLQEVLYEILPSPCVIFKKIILIRKGVAMSYLSNFQYDVFLSYAHLDNETINDTEDGWITKFYKQFQLEMKRYLEGKVTANLWCDHELRKNYAFDNRIKNVIENSAIFLAFTSNGFFRSEYCCDKELNFFYTKAKSSKWELVLNDHRRIFNVQLLNIPHPKWPEELQGGLGYAMFRASDKRTTHIDQDPGITLDSEEDGRIYNERIVEIVRDVCDTLREMKKMESAVPANQPVSANKIFIGKVADTLAPMKTQIINELTAANILVDSETIPPPYIKSEHERAVIDKLNESVLSLHLFDDIAGDKIQNDYPYSFSQEQFFISEKTKKAQLVFIPQQLEFSKIADQVHGKFLSELLSQKTPDSKYNLIREFSVPQIIEHIKGKLVKPAIQLAEDATLLDYNSADIIAAVNFFNDLQIANKNIRLAPPGNGPSDAIEKYWQLLNEVTTVIIVCLTVAKEWLQERIKQIICAIRTGKSRVCKLQLYSERGIENIDIDQLNKLF